jgi:uncharacterized protein (TIGR02646 family)
LFPDPPRSAVRGQLSIDQGHICCYCSGGIARGNFHIEHFRPRDPAGPYQNLTYRWANLLASCQTSSFAAVKDVVIVTQLHCGDAKGNWFEQHVTVSPLQRGVESLFRYTLRGKVFPSKALRSRKASVQTTIDKLNLNAPVLVARRERLLKQADEDASIMSRANWLAHYLRPNANGLLQEFWPALRYNYEKHWSGRFP